MSVVVRAGEGTPVWFMGGLAEVKAGSQETDGALTAIEWTIGPGWAAPPHRHDYGEVAYVIEGTLRVRMDDRTVDAPAGTFLFFPKGTAEWFDNATASQARLLIMYMKAGIENLFTEMGEPAQSRTIPPAPPPPTAEQIEALTAAAKMYGTEMLPPPQ